jgi:hypothetical protein
MLGSSHGKPKRLVAKSQKSKTRHTFNARQSRNKKAENQDACLVEDGK